MRMPIFRQATTVLGFIAFLSTLFFPDQAAALSAADCDCTQNLGSCAAGGEVVSTVVTKGAGENHYLRDPQLRWKVRMYWSTSSANASCALVEIGIRGEHNGMDIDGRMASTSSIWRERFSRNARRVSISMRAGYVRLIGLDIGRQLRLALDFV